MTALEELRQSLDDPRWTQELWLIGRALVELGERLEAEQVRYAPKGV